jgi:hypothetical protein
MLNLFVMLIAVASLGIFVGAMLTEGFVLVPYWRTIPADAFYVWYAVNAKRLVGFFSPLTWFAGLTTLAAAGLSLWSAHPGRWYVLASAVCMLVVVAMFFVYFEQANASFSLGKMSATELGLALDRWASWHWARCVCSLAALTSAIFAVSQ